MLRLGKSKLFRFLAVLMAVFTAVLSLGGCAQDEVIDTALTVLEAVLSDSGESAPSEQSAPPESANAPPQTETESEPAEPPSDISSGSAAPPPSSEPPKAPEPLESPSPSSSVSVSKSESESSSIPESPSQAMEEEPDSLSVDEDGWYSDRDSVALYLHTFGKLPGNFITKKEASALGWNSQKGNLWEVAEGMSIGGDSFGNREGLLPAAKGRKWYECDINYQGGYRGAERILYSSDGLIYYTGDHYQSYTQLY